MSEALAELIKKDPGMVFTGLIILMFVLLYGIDGIISSWRRK